MPHSELILNTTPPRLPRHQLARPRLALDGSDCPVLLVQAPAGFGKTSVLGQWRRELLAQGTAVAWLTVSEACEPQRFLRGLVHAVATACHQPDFGRQLLARDGAGTPPMEGVTAWLAAVALLAPALALIIDEAERLSPAARAQLVYLLHNVPPNLQVLVGAREVLAAQLAGLAPYGQARVLDAEQLRFRLDETLELVRARSPARLDVDGVARLHAQTEGWPLGLQMLLAAPQGHGLATAGLAPSHGGRGASGHLLDGLLDALAPADADFLVKLACLEQLHPDLCRAVSDDPATGDRLERLMRTTPLFVAAESGHWSRLHALALDALRQRLAQRPQAERSLLHQRAMGWLQGQGMLAAATQHAYAAGLHDAACAMAEGVLYEAAQQGLHNEILEWVERFPLDRLLRGAHQRLSVGWMYAISARHAEAPAVVDCLLEPGVDAEHRLEATLVCAGAAVYADQPDRAMALALPALAGAGPLANSVLEHTCGNVRALLAILAGDPAEARLHLQKLTPTYHFGMLWSRLLLGLSYMWEGQFRLAREVLEPALAIADAELGRRHPMACMLAACLAAVLYEADSLAAAESALADRLDVLERDGMPETVVIGFRTASRIALARGNEHRALDVLEGLRALGVSRQMPRLCMVAWCEQARVHALRGRSASCQALAESADALCDGADGPIARLAFGLNHELIQVYAAIGRQDWARAAALLEAAEARAAAVRLGRWRLELMALRGLALERAGSGGAALLREAAGLAQVYGLLRVLPDSHPLLDDWLQAAGGGPAPEPAPAAARPQPRAVPNAVLTPKEREVLELLARKLSNKEIAQAMGVGEETVKWHLKNLFGKLSAASRRHAVRRAELLGLLVDVA